jgi:hypothetical protein
MTMYLKGSLTRDFSTSGFFASQFPTDPWVSYRGHFKFFSQILGDIHNVMFITGYNNTDNKLSIGVNDISDKVSPVSLLLTINLSRESLTLAITPCNTGDNISPITTTLAIHFLRCRWQQRWDNCYNNSLPTPQSKH